MRKPGLQFTQRSHDASGHALADFNGLVDHYLDRVFRFLYSMTGDYEMARDSTQETFLRLQEATTAKHVPSGAYIFTTARNVAISQLRRRSLERRHVESKEPVELEPTPDRSTDKNPAELLERAETRQALLSALAELPEEQRSVFLLSEVEGLRYEQIAESLGCSPGTVASRKHNAVAKLRSILGRAGHAL